MQVGCGVRTPIVDLLLGLIGKPDVSLSALVGSGREERREEERRGEERREWEMRGEKVR